MALLAELDLYGDIGGEEGLSASAVRKFLRENKDAKDITVRIKSSGGDVLEGMTIYNLLVAHPAKVTVHVHGLAASIASIIAMAGDEVCITEGSFLMIHNPYAVTKGEASKLRQTAEVLDKMSKSMVDVYMDRTGKSKDEICKMMDAETWMSAKEAVAAGFADKIVKVEKQSDKKEAKYNLGCYAHVPQELLVMGDNARMESKETQMDEETKKKIAELEDKLAKSMKECAALKKAKADADEEAKAKAAESDDDGDGDEDEEAKAELPPQFKKKDGKAKAQENTMLMALAEANKMVKQLSDRLGAVEKGKFEARVTDAVKAGKLLPSQKNWALALDETDFDAYLEAVGDNCFPLGKEHQEDEIAAKAKAGVSELTAEEKKLAKNMGISEAELIAYNKANPQK